MQCPACFNKLSAMQVGNVSVDVCQGGCGGIWFDAFELQRVDDQTEVAGEAMLHIERDPKVRVDPNRKRACPKCEGMKLKRHFFSARRRVEVDECPNCGGYLLGAGGVGQNRQEKKQTATASPKPSPLTSAAIPF